MIFEYNIPDYHTTFDWDTQFKGHSVMMTRRQITGNRIIRYNSVDECEVQFIGLARIRGGEGNITIPSGHHIFRFGPLVDKFFIKVQTDGYADDQIMFYNLELLGLLAGFDASIKWYNLRGIRS